MYYLSLPARQGKISKAMTRQAPAGLDVTRLIPTTYNDKIVVLCNSFGGMGL